MSWVLWCLRLLLQPYSVLRLLPAGWHPRTTRRVSCLLETSSPLLRWRELTPCPPAVAEHEITQGAFAHLESAFESYRAADPQRDAYVVTSSTAVFDPLVVSTSVAWPIVLKALLGHFGTTDKSRREAVDPGRLGFARVMDVLRKTNGIAQDPMRSEAAEILLSRLHRAVMCVQLLLTLHRVWLLTSSTS